MNDLCSPTMIEHDDRIITYTSTSPEYRAKVLGLNAVTTLDVKILFKRDKVKQLDTQERIVIC